MNIAGIAHDLEGIQRAITNSIEGSRTSWSRTGLLSAIGFGGGGCSVVAILLISRSL